MLRFDTRYGHGSSGAISSAQVSFIDRPLPSGNGWWFHFSSLQLDLWFRVLREKASRCSASGIFTVYSPDDCVLLLRYSNFYGGREEAVLSLRILFFSAFFRFSIFDLFFFLSLKHDEWHLRESSSHVSEHVFSCFWSCLHRFEESDALYPTFP